MLKPWAAVEGSISFDETNLSTVNKFLRFCQTHFNRLREVLKYQQNAFGGRKCELSG